MLISNRKLIGFSVLVGIVFAGVLITTHYESNSKAIIQPATSIKLGVFDGERAMRDLEFQVSLSPRTPGSKSHEIVRNWIIEQLKLNGWSTKIQPDVYNSQPIYNLIGNYAEDAPYILIGAHYDSRLYADKDSDPSLINQAVPGANDGASGVSVLLELARTIPEESRKNIWLVFFDAEDQGRINGWDWILGSQSFVNQIPSLPEKVVIIDMVGDKDLQLYYESNSDAKLQQEIWNIGAESGYQKIFHQQYKHTILDDHIPFAKRGIPSIDLIDFDYSYWHTTQDLTDKVSADSLQAVGTTLLRWIAEQ
jgi:glutaminyl-peptide cyclotransferase